MTKNKMTALVVGFGLLLSAHGYAAELTYPGAAPCDTTLQACIDGASAGDAIAIATGERIDEDLKIAKSLSLIPAAGVTPMIGSADPKTLRKVVIQDEGVGTPAVAVSLVGIDFDGAVLEAFFGNGSGHSFTLKDSSVYSEITDGLVINANVPMTAVIERNSLVSVTRNLRLYTSLKSGTVSLEATGNLITSSNNAASYGVQLDLRGGGSVVTAFRNNLIYHVSGCGCGASSGIDASLSDGVNASLSFVNNTIDDTQVGSGAGIYLNSSGSTGTHVVDIFNNVITNTYRAVDLPAVNAKLTVNSDNNHFFANKHPVNSGGYDLGADTVLDAAMVDPLYVDVVNRNYHLKPSSPLIDAGENSPSGGLPATDADGKARVIDGTVDIGAFESGQAVSDLDVTQDFPSTEATVGEQITIALTVTNHGPEASVNTVLTDALPEGLAYVTSYADPGVCSFDGVVTCALGDLAVDETALVVIVVDVEAEGTLANKATVSGDSFDPDVVNNDSDLSFTAVDAGAGTSGGGDTAGTSGAEGATGGCSLVR